MLHKPRKPISQRGKYYKKWINARNDWFKLNPQIIYTCYICGKQMEKQDTTLDHVKPRGSNPDLRYELSNLRPCCWTCNSKKGSKSLDSHLA